MDGMLEAKGEKRGSGAEMGFSRITMEEKEQQGQSQSHHGIHLHTHSCVPFPRPALQGREGEINHAIS